MKTRLVKVICSECNGSGNHSECGGRGWSGGLFSSRCTDCSTSGKCPECHGEGHFVIEEGGCIPPHFLPPFVKKVICGDCSATGKHSTCRGTGFVGFFCSRCDYCNKTGICPHCIGAGYYYVENQHQCRGNSILPFRTQ